MASPRGIRGRSVELQLLASPAPGSAPQPVSFTEVQAFTAEPRVNKENVGYIGKQGTVPDWDYEGYDGTFTAHVSSYELPRLQAAIEAAQYGNQEVKDIRFVVAMKLPGGAVRQTTYKGCVLSIGSQIQSRSGFVQLSGTWSSEGPASYVET